ncbi:putative membrane protein [Wickerhamomyces ciferrii]|uniref:Membrane protein n=1 Tax=Wickerhamomyces ciferrii (strain ATCC 14091 / BCRC 22168 / CBS 111 / JCM 3599 / NBRC 0793 / NRRL Y-1031 F-60-10) TaxID=1206466 RepID=K0KMS9_WICCF|nr:uncharacterized protein BN7_6178 [Wickerhamomyces ciferrii]CCH46585.1 putative membrane protein [Wickerhamomyces ciferrii]
MAPKKNQESFRQQMKGFPWSQIFVISLVRFAEPIAFTSLFPYVYFMVKDFGVAENEAEVSKYSGYLSSTFAFCQVLTSFNWGKFADKNGRKPTLIIGLTGSIISLLLLGFAKNYYWALLARSTMGLLNGNVAVIRTMIGEVATERKHQALAFSTMPLIFQVGCVVGPLIGGFLSGKTTRFNVLRPLVEKYPYALPNLFVSALLFISMITAIFFLEETHYKHKYRFDPFVELGDSIKRYIFKIEPKSRAWHKLSIDNTSKQRRNTPPSPAIIDEETALLDEDDDEDNRETSISAAHHRDYSPEIESDESIKSVGNVLTRRQSVALVRSYSLHESQDDEKINYKELLTPHIFYAVVCNFIMSLHIVVHDEFLPIFLAYDVARDKLGNLISEFPLKIVGGLNYTSEDTGQLLSSTGVLGVIFVLFVFPYVDRHYDCLTTYKNFIKIFPICYFLVPYLVFFADHKTLGKLSAYTLTCLKTLGTSISFPQILLIVHNCSPPKHRALINGATISVSALARCTGPLIWGFIMSWGQNYQIAWIGWWLLSLISLLAVYQSRYLKDSNDEDDEEEESHGDEEEEIRS